MCCWELHFHVCFPNRKVTRRAPLKQTSFCFFFFLLLLLVVVLSFFYWMRMVVSAVLLILAGITRLSVGFDQDMQQVPPHPEAYPPEAGLASFHLTEDIAPPSLESLNRAPFLAALVINSKAAATPWEAGVCSLLSLLLPFLLSLLLSLLLPMLGIPREKEEEEVALFCPVCCLNPILHPALLCRFTTK